MIRLNLKNSISIATCLLAISFTACKKKEVTPTVVQNPVSTETYSVYYTIDKDTSNVKRSNYIDTSSVNNYFSAILETSIEKGIDQNTNHKTYKFHLGSSYKKNNTTVINNFNFEFLTSDYQQAITFDVNQKNKYLDSISESTSSLSQFVITDKDSILYTYEAINKDDAVIMLIEHFPTFNGDYISGTFLGNLRATSEFNLTTKNYIDYANDAPDKMKSSFITGSFKAKYIIQK
jgi:hypothetical protein